MHYLLDTNAVIALLNDPSGPVARRVRTQSPRNVAISSVVLHELYYGAYKSAAVERNLRIVDSLRFDVLPFDPEDAHQASRVRAALAAGGIPIGAYDVLIAGQACARRLTLVTRNVREFRHVTALRVENWRDYSGKQPPSATAYPIAKPIARSKSTITIGDDFHLRK